MHDNQLREDIQAKHAFMMYNAADWRQTRNLPAASRPTVVGGGRMQLIWAAMVNLLVGH